MPTDTLALGLAFVVAAGVVALAALGLLKLIHRAL